MRRYVYMMEAASGKVSFITFTRWTMIRLKHGERVILRATGILQLALSALLALAPCYAQTVNATLYGSVTDPTGAAIPEANVIATNVATGIATKNATDASGNYILPSLPPGTYNVTVEKTGFRSTVLSGVTLLVDQKARLDAQLQVGQVSTTVEVTGAAPLVETKTASIGTVIGEREVVELPLNLRRFTALSTLVPGTATTNGGYTSLALGSPFSEATYTANGNRDASNILQIDGMESRAYETGGFGLAPPPEAVQEFKIQTNIYSAAFGKTAGSTINLVTKSGTNELHATAYEFLRNDKLDARNFFATNQTDPLTGAEIPGSSRPKFRRNQFGFAVGGPVRKNKTFFFGYYDALREIKGLSLTNFVPTDSQKAGDFSSVLTQQTINLCGAGGPANLNFDSGQLFDPATESLFACPAGSANAGSTILVGNPIPGNKLTNIDPVALKVLAAFPESNRPGFPNYVNQIPHTRFDHQFGARIDHNFGPSDQLYGRYLFGQSLTVDPQNAYSSLPGFWDKLPFRGQNVALGWTHTFGAHLLNEARFGFQRNWQDTNCQKCPRGAGFVETFGVKNLRALGPELEGFPFFGFSNFGGVGDSGYRPATGPDMVEKYEDNLTWTRGRHTIVVGADMQWWQSLRQENPFSPHGQFFFNGQFSSLAGEIPNVSGLSDLADFLLGYPNNAAMSLSYRDMNLVGGTFWNWYGQDDIKLSPNLSLNLGLRYEYRRPPVDKRNNIVQFIPLGLKFSGPGNGILVTAADEALNDSFCADPFYSYLTTADGRCLVATSAERARLGFTGRSRRTIDFPYKRDFAPRVGLTWRPLASDKLIVRTGYGIFYDLGNLNILQFVSGNPVFSPTSVYNTAFGSPPPLTSGVPTTTENVFASPSIPHISQQYAAMWVSPDFQPPRVQQWSFGFESQFATNWALEAGYIGTKADHLDNGHIFFNQPEPGVGDLQPRRPYPDFNIMAFFTSDNSSIYHSLQMKLTKRFSKGLTFLTSYTLAKSIDNGEGNENGGTVPGNNPQDDNNLRANRARFSGDAHQRFVFSYIWQLPVGHGKRFLNRGGAVNGILGGWELSGILSFQSGFPFGVLSAQDFSNTGSPSPYPDRICNGTGKRTAESWFDTSCFTTAALQQALASGHPRFGNSGRNILDGPGSNDWDLAMIKNFQFTERLQITIPGGGL